MLLWEIILIIYLDKYRPLSNRLNLVLTNNKSLLENNPEINLYYFNFKYEEDKLVKIERLYKVFKNIKIQNIYSRWSRNL